MLQGRSNHWSKGSQRKEILSGGWWRNKSSFQRVHELLSFWEVGVIPHIAPSSFGHPMAHSSCPPLPLNVMDAMHLAMSIGFIQILRIFFNFILFLYIYFFELYLLNHSLHELATSLRFYALIHFCPRRYDEWHVIAKICCQLDQRVFLWGPQGFDWLYPDWWHRRK